MVVVKGKDKRRGNESDNLEVISHTKGMRTMGGPMSGRFAADMRVRVGGYGRPDQTWGVDHPWHKTQDVDLHQMISAKDRLEEGLLVEEKPQGQGLSRAALKRKKKQQKKGIVPAAQAAATPENETKPSTQHSTEEKTVKQKKKLALFDDSDDDNDESEKPAPEQPAKKAKVEQPKKQQKAEQAKKQQKAKSKRELQKQQRDKEEAEKDLHLLVEEKPQLVVLPLPEREALAAEYDASLGTEIETPSGILIRDVQLGQGQLPAPGQTLTVRYKGSLGKGGSVFGKGMLTVKFGQGAIIAGWEEGLSTMRPSGKRLLTIPPALAYGSEGKGEKIPPNSTLYFEVELVRIGTRQRDAVGEDDMPLPKAFVRQRIKESKGKKKANEDEASNAAPAKKKKRIRY
ncbi:peptidylprolyl isomerase fpr4 [Aphanomyces cochlioides]|nr:peptidylprolyl isomerase fpr4 [Aphanomyces cochlioides]